MFFIIFVLINPVFVKIDTSFWVTLYVPENYFAMLTTSVFLASIQVFAFWGALLDKPENSEFLQSAKEKIFDWVCVIIVLRALQCPDAEFWSAKITKPFPKQPKRKILNYKVVLRPDKTDFNIYDICQKLKDLNPASRLLRFELYRNSKKRDLDAEIAIQDWIWTQPLSRDEPILLSIPQDNIQDEELHLLGRNNWLRGDEIPDGWFGETEESALFGKKIWSLDNTHQIIMHPRVDLSDLAVFVTVRLFRKLEKSDEYRSLAEKITTLAKNQYPKKDIIEVRFYCRTLEEKIAELSWLDTQPDTYFYKDETINKLKKYRFRKN